MAFVDTPGEAICTDALPPGLTAPAHLTTMRVEALDAGGALIGCIGTGGRTPTG